MPNYNDIIIKAGLPLSDSIGGEKVTLVNFTAVLIEGHKGIFSYAGERIVVLLKRGSLSITGENLKIIEINADEIYVSGKISALERE